MAENARDYILNNAHEQANIEWLEREVAFRLKQGQFCYCTLVAPHMSINDVCKIANAGRVAYF